LIERLPPGPIALDTAVFIYLIEDHLDFAPALSPLFAAAEEGRVELVTSALTLLEVLVVPMRRGDVDLAKRYETVLTRGRGLRLVDLDRTQLRSAAHLRAAQGIRTPDALQLAAALTTGCGCFLTNDRRLPVLPRLPVLQLDEVVASGR
jgi:predicted nucleic acid-binding protein